MATLTNHHKIRLLSARLVSCACLAVALIANVSQAWAAGPGAQWYNEYLEKDLLYPDEKWHDYVTEIGERLLAVSPHKGQTYTFVVTDEPFVNAWATPDAYIFVTRGIISQFQSEDELAGVVGGGFDDDGEASVGLGGAEGHVAAPGSCDEASRVHQGVDERGAYAVGFELHRAPELCGGERLV